MLALGSNKLTSLPDEICELSNLRELYVADNQITVLPPLDKLKLKTLCIHTNPISLDNPYELLDYYMREHSMAEELICEFS